MFKQFVDAVRQVLFLLRDVEQNRKGVATLKEQLAETNQFVRQLALEFRHLSEREQQEREKHALQIENILLRFERQLPPAKATKKSK
jgi:hypothetical protein